MTVPPPLRSLRSEADPAVGVRVLITPEVATEWLETRGDNRKVMQTVVDTYATDMKEGRWVFNGAPIQFDEHGKLLNGQHRLWAIIESGCSIEAVVQWGIPRAAQATIDTGAKWRGKDVLYMKGEKNVSLLQATLKWVDKDEKGMILGMRPISNSQTLEVLERHPNVRRSVDFISSVKGPLYASVAAFLHYKIAPEDPEKADTFFQRLADGLELTEQNPIYRLRERLGLSWKSMAKIGHTDAMALAIIAWNAYRAGRNLSLLTWRKTGSAAMAFPVIEGAGTPVRVSKPKPRKARAPETQARVPRPDHERREVESGVLARHTRK